jgi:hypothetical protein
MTYPRLLVFVHIAVDDFVEGQNLRIQPHLLLKGFDHYFTPNPL